MFGPKPSGGGSKVKGFVRELLEGRDNGDKEATIVVSELSCSEPGCPPIETVIAIFRGPSDTRRYKIHKAQAEITRDDVAGLLGHG